MALELNYDQSGITLRLPAAQGGLRRLFRKPSALSLRQLPVTERDLICAIADLLELSADDPGNLRLSDDSIWISHEVASQLHAADAATLGLPRPVDLTFSTEVEGVVGAANFRLVYRWSKAGHRQTPPRVGAILETGQGPRLIPHWMLKAIEVADGARLQADDATDWEALARFRQALEPGLQMSRGDSAARMSMTDFLSGLEVRLADSFSLSPNGQATDFEVVPFSRERLQNSDANRDGEVDESQGELTGEALHAFQRRLRDRGALSAYRVKPGSYLIVDSRAMTVLRAMAEKQRGSLDERREFISNPRPAITAAVEAELERRGVLEGLDAAGIEETVEALAGPSLVETAQFSSRVVGLKVYEPEPPPPGIAAGGSWMPEDFGRKLKEFLGGQTKPELERLREEVSEAIAMGQDNIVRDGLTIPARPETLQTIDARLAGDEPTDVEADEPPGSTGPIVLDSKSNLRELQWFAELRPRKGISRSLPSLVRTPLKPHQTESFDWQVSAWEAGLPGVLNADEQGLGKTLQTIAFLTWLQSNMIAPSQRKPLLVVAPTSLLMNWEQEVERHLGDPGLGHVIRLYGSGTESRKRVGQAGKDIDSGESKLDLEFLHEAVAEGRAHRFWVLTTYTTLTNYQHSLATIPFAAAVYDEIQTLKNSRSMRSAAARGVMADFTIGLTGTPIENSVLDIWSIMDQVASGRLDTEANFLERYRNPDAANMADLHARIFKPQKDIPPTGVRRLKSQVAKDLPAKSRRLYPRLMPKAQELAYEDAKLKLAQGGLGAALKMLHHIRAVSVHPDLDGMQPNDDFIDASARLTACFELIRRIRAAGERALVFIEHRRMQYRFIELAKAEFNLSRIDLINGDTPIKSRQDIVNRFQAHGTEPGFDMLVLGPKAAGTGLTLTAATHVIHLSRWWNPAVEEQCNDRVHRIGQTKPITVHLPMAIHGGYRENSFDCLLNSLMQKKRSLAESALWPMGDTDSDSDQLQAMVSESADQSPKGGDAVRLAIEAMFSREDLGAPDWQPDGSVQLKA